MLNAFLIAAATHPAFVTPEPIPVSFTSGGETLRGHLYLPEGASAAKKVPAVIVTGAWFTIKEQMPTTYAREFVRRGHAALVFDFRGFGESAGKARNTENPEWKTEDILAAARWMAKRPEVNAQRLSGYAMCASTGYMADAIGRGAPLKSFAAGALWIQDSAAVEAVYGGAQNVNNLIKVGEEAAQRFAADGTVVSVPAAGPVGSDAIMQQAPYYTDRNRGMIDKWENRFALMSWRYWLRFDSLKPASKLKVPTLVIHSDNAALPDMTRRFFAELSGERTIYWTTESHMDFYDAPGLVQNSVARAIAHADFYLAGQRSDAEKIEHAIHQMVQAVDAKAWAGAARHFAPKLNVDYASLGGPKGEVESAKLLKDWEAFHAKFHTMRHTYTDFDIVVRGTSAMARYRGTATLQHKQGETHQAWTVKGQYESTLERTGSRWVITGTKFDLESQHGQP